MACVQRMIKLGTRFYKPRVINYVPPATFNHRSCCASPFLYRSLCSGPCDEGRFIPPEGKKRYYFIDTLAMVKGLEAQGIPPKHAEAITSSMVGVLDELEKDPKHRFKLLQSKADCLRRSIKKMRRESAQEDAIVQYSSLNLPKRVLEKHANRCAKTVPTRIDELDEERMRLEAKESEGTFHMFLSLCIATVCASMIGMSAALMILFDQLYKS